MWFKYLLLYINRCQSKKLDLHLADYNNFKELYSIFLTEESIVKYCTVINDHYINVFIYFAKKLKFYYNYLFYIKSLNLIQFVL